MTIACVDPRTDLLWERLLDQKASSVFHSPAWMQVLTDSYGFEVSSYVLLDKSAKPAAGIPFCRIKDIRGNRLVSLPFSDYCDPLVGEQAHWDKLMDTLSRDGDPITLRCLDNGLASADRRFQLVKEAKWHAIDLRPSVDTLWLGLHESSRRAVRKARRDGVVVRKAETKEELRAFFELHLRIRAGKYRLLAQPYSFFEHIWRHFVQRQMGLLLLAIHRGEVISSVLYLEWNNTLYYKFNASAERALTHRPNDLLIWEGIQYGKGKNYAQLDFGLSDSDQEGLLRYKRKYASTEKTIQFLRHEPNGGPGRQEREVGELLPKLTDLFTDQSVSQDVTERAGEVLYKFFT